MSPEELSAIHHECFKQPRPWTPKEFQLLLNQNILLWKSRSFLLGREINGEAEILTLAVSPNERRRGLASSLLKEFLTKMKQIKVRKIILEVNKNNKPALNLYQNFCFEKVGEREAYYKPNSESISSDALLLEYQISYEN